MSYQLGSTAGAPTTVAQWAAQVRARGNVATVFPDGPYKGQLAERYRDSSGFLRYSLPPANIRQLDMAERRGDSVAQAAGTAANVATAILNPVSAVSNAILAAPRGIASKVLGIPPGLVTLLTLGAGGYLFYNFVSKR